MSSGVIRSFIATLSGFAAVACAAPHLGAWEHNDGSLYRRVVFASDGTCVVVSGAIFANHRDGIGAPCRYSKAGDIISITELGGDSSLEKLPQLFSSRLKQGGSRPSATIEKFSRVYQIDVHMTTNNAFERTGGHRGCAVLAMNCVLGGAEWAPCQAAQLDRYAYFGDI